MDNKEYSLIQNVLFYIVLFLLTTFFCVKFNVIDYDFWARLIQGYSVFNHHSVMYNDIISYTPTHTWFDPEWLSSTIIYIVAKKYSFIGLTILKIALFYSMFVMISLALKSRSIMYFLLILLALNDASIIKFCIRCQIFTFLLFAIWILILEKVRKGNDNLLYALPFIMLLWLNCHGGCMAGVGILVLYIIGEALNKKPINKYLIALIFVCAVFLINPWGIQYIKFLFDSAFIDRSWISEWQSPFSNPLIAYKLFLFFAIFSYIFKIIKEKIKFCNLDKTKLLVFLALIVLSAKYIKHSGLFIIGSSILLYDAILYCYLFFTEKIKNYLKIDDTKTLIKVKNILLYIFICLYSLYGLFICSIKNDFANLTTNVFPLKAVEFLKINNIKGNIFAPFYLCSYIAYKTYPDILIFMDGRQEQVYYPDIFDKQMFFVYTIGDKFDDVIKEYPHNIMLFDKDSYAADYFKKNKNWSKVYVDEKYIVFIKKNMLKFNYIQPQKSDKELFDGIFDSVFY